MSKRPVVTQVSERGAFTIACDEALVPTRYRDKVGVDTWGIGHTDKAGAPFPTKMSFKMPTNIRGIYDEAWDVFEKDLKNYATDVIRAFGSDLAQHELDGLTAWHFNTGGALSSSSVKHWRAGNKTKALQIIRSWNKVTRNGQKVVSDVLAQRRDHEIRIIQEAKYPVGRLPVYGTDGHGNIIWSPIESFSWVEWKELIAKHKPGTLEGPKGLGALLAQLFGKRKGKRA